MGGQARLRLTLSVSLAVVGLWVAQSSAGPLQGPPHPTQTPANDEADDDGGYHGANEPWVDCPRRRHVRATDSLGPVVAHGAREAPGFRLGLLQPPGERFFRRSSLQLDPFGEELFFTGLSLPSQDPSREELARIVELAVRLAGKRVPAAPLVTAERRAPDEGGERRIWDVAFVHEGVRVTPAGCQLSAPATRLFPAALSCRVPSGDSARGRVYVVHFDGRNEILTVLDAAGQVLASGPNEKSFAFNGYDPDYIGGLKKVQTQMEVGDGQTVHLDTALHDGTKVSCITPDGGQYYPTGFAVCGNDILLVDPAVLGQPLIAPRSDDDYTNPAKAPPPPQLPVDPLGPQLLLLTQQYGVGAIHGTLNDVTVRAALLSSTGWVHYVRDDNTAGTLAARRRPHAPRHQQAPGAMTRALAVVALAALCAACGCKTDASASGAGGAPTWPASGCSPGTELTGGRCRVREIYVPGGTFTMGRGYCPSAGVHQLPPSFSDCPLADAPHEVTVAPFWIEATTRTYAHYEEDAECPRSRFSRLGRSGPVTEGVTATLCPGVLTSRTIAPAPEWARPRPRSCCFVPGV